MSQVTCLCVDVRTTRVKPSLVKAPVMPAREVVAVPRVDQFSHLVPLELSILKKAEPCLVYMLN